MSNDLPQGWVQVRLRDVLAQLESGSRPKGGVREIRDGIPSIGGEHLTSAGDFDLRSIRYVPHAFYAGMTRGHLRRGDVLVVKDGATTGKVALVRDDFPFERAVVNEHVFICRPGPGVDPAFLFWFLWSSEGQRRILDNFQGSAQGGINQSFAENTSIPVAPMAEQRRVVAEVAALLARVDAARARLAKVPAILKRFRQSVLADACSGRLIDGYRPAGLGEWPLVPLHDVVESLDQGWSPKCATEASPSPEVWAVIKTTAVQPLSFDERENKRLPDRLEPRPRLEVKPGDLLITRAGPRARAGITCLVRAVRPRLMVCDKVYRVRVRSTVALGDFVNLVLNEPSIVEEIDSMKTGISDSGVNLTQRKFLQLRIPLPALDEQREIVSRVDRLFAFAAAIERRIEAAAARADRLTWAILAKAFRGELVPTEAELARAEELSLLSSLH